MTEKRSGRLPVEYFHVVFTLPAAIAQIAYWNKKAVYGLLFRASAETVMTIAADPKRMGARVMVTFIDPDSGDADDLEAIAHELSAATSETQRDIARIHGLLTRALTKCLDCGWLTGDTEDRPCHLTRLMMQAVSDGDRLRELEESYHAALNTMADVATQESRAQGT